MKLNVSLFYNTLCLYYMYWLLWTNLAPQNVYSSNVLEDEDVIGSNISDTRGVFFCIFAVNKNFGTHPNIFLGIILPYNSCQNVCDSNGLEDRAISGSSTTDKKGVVIFRDFAEDRDFGTYHMLFLGVKLP